ncbi:hexosaminidase [Entomortierella parvispora]|uniref:beta-N-acetylhexosaminidase n=1 Tax=Entomortierella parvispora TaxID=205924 RepID=A0A9P3HNM4_9FUNG|nr:hexosaminidase [Entomortierella parvispora]
MPTRKPIRSSLLPSPLSSSIQYSALSAHDDNDDNWDHTDHYAFDSMSSTPDHSTPSRRDSLEIETHSQTQGPAGGGGYNGIAGVGASEFDASTSTSASNISRSSSIAHRHIPSHNNSTRGQSSEGQVERQGQDEYEGDKRDHHNGPFVKNTHWNRCWIRYIAVSSILVAVALLVTLLVLKPWQHRYQLAPVNNGAVKALPAEQPIWPIPREFATGTEKISLSPNFQITVKASSPVNGVSSPLIEKAIARCMDRIKIKLNTTIYDTPSLDTPVSTPATGLLSQLVIIVDNSAADLDYGVDESYTLNISSSANTPSSKSTNQQDDDSDMVKPSQRKRAVPVNNLQESSATIRASTQWGVLHALETFSQLVVATAAEAPTEPVNNTLNIPNAPWSIYDAPRYSHRGLLLDTSRHFVAVKDIIRTLEAMTVVKLNVFHWHVLDQQSYPLVSKTFPELTAKGAERADRVYSYDDVASIIQYGQERGIRVIPEFDAPGHAASWGRAFPNITVCVDAQPHQAYGAEPPAGQLDPLEPFTYQVLNGLIKEWSAQFPDKQVHIGGDEINFNCWKTSERLKDYIDHPSSREGYESKLPATIVNQDPRNQMKQFGGSGSQSGGDKLLDLYLSKALGMYLQQGKRPIAWEELALEHQVNLPESTIVHVWKNARNAKKIIDQGLPVILSSAEFWYLDCGMGSWLIGSLGQSWCKYASWQRIYSYNWEAELSEAQKKMVLGGEIAMWGEQTDGHNLDSNLWPRSAAAAEVLWSGSKDDNGEIRPLVQAFKRLSQVRERLVEMGVQAAPIAPSWCGKHPEGCLA